MKKYLVSILAVLVLFIGGGKVFAEDGIKTFGETLREVDLIEGDGTGLNPQSHLTREEMVTIINKLYREELIEDFIPPEKPSFKDVPKDHWAYKQVEFAYEKGISKGISASEFGLGQKINANQAALFLIRIMGYDDEIMGEEINYKDAYRKVYLLLDIKASNLKDPFAPLLRGDVFQMTYDALWAKTPHGVEFVYEVFGYEEESSWKTEIILGGDRYCCYYEMHDIIPSDSNSYASFMPIYQTEKELFEGYLDFKANEITKTLDMSYYDNLKSYLLDLNKTDSYQSMEYTNAMLIKMLKRDNNIFVETINDITSNEMEDIYWDELNNLLGDKIAFELRMWTPHKDRPDEHTYLYPYKAKGLVLIDTSKANFEFNYDRPAEEGMDWENVTYLYDIKNIQVDKKTQSKFLFSLRIADDQYQELDLFFAFEYDFENKTVRKAASCNAMGFGILNEYLES